MVILLNILIASSTIKAKNYHKQTPKGTLFTNTCYHLNAPGSFHVDVSQDLATESMGSGITPPEFKSALQKEGCQRVLSMLVTTAVIEKSSKNFF